MQETKLQQRRIELLGHMPEVLRTFFFEFSGNHNREASYQALMELSDDDIRRIKVGGWSINAIVTQSGWDNPDQMNVQTPTGFRAFVSWLFGKNFKKLNPENIRDYFFNIAGRGKKEASYRYFMQLNQEEIHRIQLYGKSIVAIVSRSGWENPDQLKTQNPINFQIFISWLFEKEYQKLDFAQIQKYMYDFAGTGMK